jgi:Peptidase family M1 domain
VHIPARGEVTGVVHVRFTPDLPTRRLVFRLWPNGPLQAREGASLVPGRVRVRGYGVLIRRPDPTTLDAELTRTLAAGDSIDATVPFRLRLPGDVLDRLSRSGDSVRLGSFFPVLAWEPGVGWDTDPPTALLAEASSTPTADFDVRITAPPGDRVLTTGLPMGGGRYRAAAVRDFAIAAGRFATATAVARAPGPVRITAAVDRGVDGSALDVARRATAALEAISARYGPYPWPALHLAVVAGLGRVGIEYPTMIFLGPEGVERTTTHEVAHQWFYSLVGNDQARDPVLDEGLATYVQAELDGIWPYLDGLPDPRSLRRQTGAPMTFWEDRPRDLYALAVYADGARMMRALGHPQDVTCALRSYVAANAYGIATQAGLARALTARVPGAKRVLRAYGIPRG